MSANRRRNPDLDAMMLARLDALEARGVRRCLSPTARHAEGATRDGRPMLSFCDNDYLGLSHDPRVHEAGVEALRIYGAGSGAARLITGDNPLNAKLEAQIARMKGMPAARVFGSGYLA